MYNCRYRKCCCQKNYDQKVIETACNDCGTTANYYIAKDNDDSCDCGFEQQGESIFPQNPLLAQSYVPIQYMDKTFTPCVRIKNGNYFS
ncbi:MAG: hypothetical protein GX682_01025 [Clostridiaceae bacterium]|nr:hypothetical protein [Clostridiaceae bacterium]